ncbi:MAG: chromosome partitioning protein ParB, partial [Rhodobacteraceae bacterium CG17_big_fil_post_rev_8_21_14_2_50_65_11]
MSEPRLIETRELDPAEIEMQARKRDVSDAAVESLMASITELGIVKDEIIVRRVKRSGALRLVAGAHRLEACRRLERPVPAKVFECTDAWAELMEIDDNIAGGELTILDTAVFLAHRKRIYEDIHPEAKRGYAGGKARHDQLTDNVSVSSFAAATAEKLGVSERKVYRLLAVGTALDPKDIRLLRAAPQPVQMSDLQHIAKIGEPAERYFVCEALGTGRAKKAAEARKAYRQGDMDAPAADPVEEGFQGLMK